MTLQNSNRTQQLTLKAQELTVKAQQQSAETRQAQLFMNIYNQSHTSPEFMKAYKKFMTTQWETSQEFTKLFNPENPGDEEFYLALAHIGSFYEGVGVLVKEDLINIRLIALLMSGMTTRFWEKIEPVTEYYRELQDFPAWLSESEYL